MSFYFTNLQSTRRLSTRTAQKWLPRMWQQRIRPPQMSLCLPRLTLFAPAGEHRMAKARAVRCAVAAATLCDTATSVIVVVDLAGVNEGQPSGEPDIIDVGTVPGQQCRLDVRGWKAVAR